MAGIELRTFAKPANIGGTLSNAWKGMQPWQKGLLMGTGGGALLGGLSSLGRRREERQPFQSALTGALAGGLLGGGLGIGYQHGPAGVREGLSNLAETGRTAARDIYTSLTSPKPQQGPPGGPRRGLPGGTPGPGGAGQTQPAAAPQQPLTPESVSNMSAEQITKLTPEQLRNSSLEVLNALEARQQALVQGARDEVGNNMTPGALGSGAVGIGAAANEMRLRKPRLRGGFWGPSDVARGMGVGGESAPSVQSVVDDLGMTVQEAEAMGRDIVREQRDQARAARKPPTGSGRLRRAYGVVTEPIRRAAEPFQSPTLHEYPDTVKETVTREPAGETVEEWIDDDTGKRHRTTKREYRDVPKQENVTSPKERVRRLMDTGRATRRAAPRNIGGRAVGYGSGLLLPLILNWAANQQAKNQAGQAMQQQLNMGE